MAMTEVGGRVPHDAFLELLAGHTQLPDIKALISGHTICPLLFIALENFKCVYCDKSQENDRGRRLVIRERCISQISSLTVSVLRRDY